MDKFLGDAVIGVFGAPVTHEDDPERVLRPALDIRERLGRFNRRWVEWKVQALIAALSGA